MSTKTGVLVPGVLGNLSRALSSANFSQDCGTVKYNKSLKCQWAPQGTHITLSALKVNILHAEPDDRI